jgi:hypothetical protein
MCKWTRHPGAAALACLSLVPVAHAQEAVGDTAAADALAKQLANPVAALISVPFQLNYDEGLGTDGKGERFTLNIQPVAPFSVSDDWNIISRTILPISDQQDVISGTSQSGLGDVTQSLFFSPKAPSASGWIWGVGPAFLLPTATEEELGAQQWAIGPTIVALKQTAEGWTHGVLWNYLVSVAGDDDRADVNSTFFQPFLAKAFPGGRTITFNLESSYDFGTGHWTVPVNLLYSKVTKIGGHMVSFAGGARYYVEAPRGGPDWGLRFVVTLLFPK